MKNTIKNSPLIKFIIAFFKKTSKDSVSAYASNSAFFLIISFFPFAMLLLSLMKYIPFDGNEILSFVETSMPSSVAKLLGTVLSEMQGKTSVAIVPITVITSLWSASRGFLAIAKGLNSVCGTSETRNIIIVRISSVVYTILFLATIVVTLLLWTFGSLLLDALTPFFRFPGIISILRWVLGFILLTLIFWFIYIFVPNRRTKALCELPGAIICAMGWIGFSFLFSFYFNNFADYDYIYGSLTAVVFLMLWVYFCMYIMLVSAEINWFLSRRFA